MVISCVTFETVKVVEPIRELKADKAYLIYHAVKAYADKSGVYEAFHKEVTRQLHEDPGLVDDETLIHVTDGRVFRFEEMLALLIKIMNAESEAGSEVFVNISAGSSEFAAAATVATMMVKGVTAFTVPVKEYMVSGEKIRQVFFEGDRPIGQAKSVYASAEMPTFNIKQPPEDLVRGLRVVEGMLAAKKLMSYSEVINQLKLAGPKVWSNPSKQTEGEAAEQNEREEKREKKTGRKVAKTATQPDKMHYLRHYLEKWEENGWIDRSGAKGREIEITPEGLNTLAIFYLD